jgi:hypothetical protein
VLVCIAGAGSRLFVSAGSGDTGPTRYTATHYVSSTADGTGDGSQGDPWTPTQAKGAVAGNIVCWLAGNGGLYEFTCTDSENAAWTPTNSGSAGNPIIHYAEYSGPDLSTPSTNANRTELSHDGVPGVHPVGRSSVLGNGTASYVYFDGFVFNWANAKPAIDGGWFRLGGQGGGFDDIRVLNCYILADEDTIGGNYPGIWAEGIDGLQIKGCVIRDLTSSTDTSDNVACVITYGCENMEIAYNDFLESETGLYIKGSASQANPIMYNSGSIHHNKMENCNRCMRCADISDTTRLLIHHNLGTGFTQYAIAIVANGVSDGRMTDLYLNTFANPDFSVSGTAVLYVGDTTSATIRIRDNILHNNQDSVVNVDASEYAQAWQLLNYNYHVQNPGTFQGLYNGTSATTIANWRTNTGAEANSTITSTVPFANMAGGDYTVSGALLTASSTGGEVGCYEGSEDPGRAFV